MLQQVLLIRPQIQFGRAKRISQSELNSFSINNFGSSVTKDIFSPQSFHFGAVTRIHPEITDPVSLRALQEEYDSRGPDPHFVIDSKIYKTNGKDSTDLSNAKHQYYKTWKNNWETAYAILTGTYRFLAQKAKQ